MTQEAFEAASDTVYAQILSTILGGLRTITIEIVRTFLALLVPAIPLMCLTFIIGYIGYLVWSATGAEIEDAPSGVILPGMADTNEDLDDDLYDDPIFSAVMNDRAEDSDVDFLDDNDFFRVV